MPTKMYGSLERLDAMVDLFTAKGNKTLDRGEVDALAGFYDGLESKSRAKIHGRLIEIYRESRYAKGQQERFMHLLQKVGFGLDELEGTSSDTAAGFLKLSKAAQLDRIKELESEWGDAGITRPASMNDLARDARSKVATKLDSINEALEKKYQGEVELGDRELVSVFVKKADGKRGDLLGYRVLLPIYAEDHDIDRAYFFNLRGDYLGDEYRGE